MDVCVRSHGCNRKVTSKIHTICILHFKDIAPANPSCISLLTFFLTQRYECVFKPMTFTLSPFLKHVINWKVWGGGVYVSRTNVSSLS